MAVAACCALAAPKAEPGSLPEQRAPAGFPRAVRLLTRRDFARVFDDARPFGSALVTVLARPNDLDHARLGMVIGKKKLRRAVDRNLMKRIIRESFRQQQMTLPALDLVVIAKPAKRVDRQRLARELAKQWRRVAGAYDDRRDVASSTRRSA